MFVLRHLPTQTYYGIRECEGARFKILAFTKYEHADQIGKSLATFHHVHNKNPPIETICYMPPHFRIRDGLDSDIWIASVNNENLNHFNQYNLDVMIINDIMDHNKGIAQMKHNILCNPLVISEYIDLLESVMDN
jgi:hypothetical protein